MLKTLALLALPAIAFGAITGSPEPTFPGMSPHFWMDLGNDNFVPGQPDDHKTASWAFGARDEDCVLGGEYIMETNKAAGTRQDVLAVNLGMVMCEESGYRFSMSLGFRNYHGIKGQELQNFDHSHTSDPNLYLTYDDNDLTGVWMCDARQTKLVPCGDQLAGYHWVLQDAITSKANEIDEAVQKVYQGVSFRAGLKLEALTASLTVGQHASYATIGVAW